ncbi:MAG: YlbF family regulator [Clostridia bacterium]|nr:YlbF family regulator [Clostridia bacterium]MEE1115999.1 YlbF family regulator [Clostridia bacterium]
MEIFEIASELGKALSKDARLIKLEEAKKAYEADEKLQNYLIEYDVQQKALSAQIDSESLDKEFVTLIQNRIDELYNIITTMPSFIALDAAQNEVNKLMDLVNSTIMYNVTGEVPSSCTHDCSSCGGCH